MISNKRFTIICLVSMVLVSIFFFCTKKNTQTSLILAGKTFSLQIASDERSRSRGLSGQVPLKDDEGMFFVFGSAGNYGFWMKDMNFSIDIIWIDSNFKILHIENEVKPESYPKIFYGSDKTYYVLEISAGQSKSLHLNVGDSVKLVKN